MPIVFFLFLSTRRHPLAMSKVTTKLLAALLAMIALNTIVLTGVMFLGLAAIDEMESEWANNVEPGLSLLEHPRAPQNYKALHSLGATLGSTTGEFLLGPVQGEIGYFLDYVFRTDFASFGSSFEAWGKNLTWAAQMLPNCSSTPAPTPSPTTPAPWGPYPSPAGEGSTCLAESVAMVGSFVSSVASKVKLAGKVDIPSTPGTPAFENGLLGLTGLFNFLKSQTRSGDWSEAGSTCKAFMNSLTQLDWRGSFTNSTGGTQTYDFNSDIRQAVAVNGTLGAICDTLATMGQAPSQ